MQNKSSFDFSLSIANLISGKILVLELLRKMFLASQVTKFFKVQYMLKNYKLVLLLLVDVARQAQRTQNNNFAIIFVMFQERGEG